VLAVKQLPAAMGTVFTVAHKNVKFTFKRATLETMRVFVHDCRYLLVNLIPLGKQGVKFFSFGLADFGIHELHPFLSNPRHATRRGHRSIFTTLHPRIFGAAEANKRKILTELFHFALMKRQTTYIEFLTELTEKSLK
jgi:hypothetical protein